MLFYPTVYCTCSTPIAAMKNVWNLAMSWQVIRWWIERAHGVMGGQMDEEGCDSRQASWDIGLSSLEPDSLWSPAHFQMIGSQHTLQRYGTCTRSEWQSWTHRLKTLSLDWPLQPKEKEKKKKSICAKHCFMFSTCSYTGLTVWSSLNTSVTHVAL